MTFLDLLNILEAGGVLYKLPKMLGVGAEPFDYYITVMCCLVTSGGQEHFIKCGSRLSPAPVYVPANENLVVIENQCDVLWVDLRKISGLYYSQESIVIPWSEKWEKRPPSSASEKAEGEG